MKFLPAIAISSKKRKVIILCVLLLIILFWWMLPRKLFTYPTSYVIEDANGSLLSASIAADGQWRFPYNKNVLKNSLIALPHLRTNAFMNIRG